MSSPRASSSILSPARAWHASALGLALGLSACGGGSGNPDAGAGIDATPPPPPSIAVFDYTIAVDVSPDGRTALLEDISTPLARAILVDTATGTATPGPDIGDPTREIATGIADTGRISAFHGDPVQAGAWTAATGWVDIPSPYPTGCDQDLASAWDVSADGAVVVGMSWDTCFPEAFRWTDASGAGVYTKLQRIGASQSSNPPTNRATVVSDDGQITAGFAENNVDRSPAMWDASGHGTLLAPTVIDTPGEVLAIDAHGDTLAGIFGTDGFVWTAATGMTTLVRFDVALPTDPVYPNTMSADGTLVFGGVGDAFFGTPIAFVWSSAKGMRRLDEVATAAGITLPTGLILDSVLGASADGTVLAGVAMDGQGATKTFVLRLPASAL